MSVMERTPQAEPSSVAEARLEREQLTEQFNDICVQLGLKNRTDGGGERLDSPEYFEWRDRALMAKRIKEKRIAYLKRWIREHEAEDLARATGHEGPVTSDGLLLALFHMTRDDAEWEDFTGSEQRLLKIVQAHLRKLGYSA